MASLNTTARELVLKIVYYGPGLGGKTTSLQAVHESAPPERRGQLVSLATPVDRTLYFDYLPLRLPPIRGMSVRLQLFTVPGQVYFNATRRLVLSGADGLVFVADSQIDRADANLESLENLRDNLAEHGRDLAQIPHIFAWNKRDLEPLVQLDELDRLLNRHGAPSFPTVATRGEGIQDALAKITELVLDAYEAQLPARAPATHGEAPPAPASTTPPTLMDRPARPAAAESAITRAEIETSAPPMPAVVSVTHEEAEVVTSARLLEPAGTFLADLDSIEAAAASAPDDDPAIEAIPALDAPPTPTPAPTPAIAAPEDVRGGRESVADDEGWLAAAEAAAEAEPTAAPPLRADASSIPAPAAPAADPPRPAEGRGTLRGSGVADVIGDEIIPARPAKPPAPGQAFTFAALFSPAERALVEQIELTIAHGDYADALGVCDAALRRVLGRVAHAIADDDEARADEASVALLLGLEGRRYLAFRALAKRARQLGDVGARDALEGYSLLLEARVLTSHWEALRDAVGAGAAPPPPRVPTAPLDDLTPLPKSSLSPPSTRDQLSIRRGGD